MAFRRTRSILTDSASVDVNAEADVIMTCAVLGFAASQLRSEARVQFDLDPGVPKKSETWQEFERVVSKIDATVASYLRDTKCGPAAEVRAGTAPDYSRGAVIMGVYQLAGQFAPPSIAEPILSAKGRALYDEIATETVPQYLGRGAYTGFVDNWNAEGDTDPVGPRPTARFLTPETGCHPTGNEPSRDFVSDNVHRRWLPPMSCAVWNPRLRKGTQESFVPWGIIGGGRARCDPVADQPNPTKATNEADQITGVMQESYKMAFVGRDPTVHDIVGYTHGMVQAIYKAYSLGPCCTPYEIAVGRETTKMASCMPCTLFMVAQGYPPTSTHLGRGESWAPLYRPYNPNAKEDEHEWAVVRDLNNSWCATCDDCLRLGMDVLAHATIKSDHLPAWEALQSYVQANRSGEAVAASLILDAVTIHDTEANRIAHTLA